VIWHHLLDTPGTKTFVEAFTAKYGKPPENQAWGDYVATKILAQAMNATGSTETDALLEYLEGQTELDVLKDRPGYFRDWDHQLIQEMYTMTAKPSDEVADEWDLMVLGAAVPAADEDLTVIAPTREENACTFAS
jgi:branched-chain amino acid transport system substrate-binding protein